MDNMELVSFSQRLDSLKYAELQHLAKQHGLKANVKADKLVKSLRKYFQQERKSECSEEDAVATPTTNEADEETGSDEEGKEDGVCVTQQQSIERQLSAGDTDNTNETSATTPLPAQESPVSSPDRKGSEVKRNRRKRRSTFEVVKPEGIPGLNSNSPSSYPRKRARRTDASGNSKFTLLRGKIPRYVGGAGKVALKVDTPDGKAELKAGASGRKAALKAGTPDWKKIHMASFNKMESIDKYVERKRRRIEVFGNSIKKTKPVSEEQPLKGCQSLDIPGPPTRAFPGQSSVAERQRSLCTSNSTVTGNDSNTDVSSIFKPSVFTVTKMSVRFTAATEVKESKLPLTKTPVRRAPLKQPMATPGSLQQKRIKKSVPKADLPKNSEGFTPYKFCGNTTHDTNKRFDLKGSLSRPLSYQPYKGKLKPWAEIKENVSKYYKQPKLQTRAERREQLVKGRKEKRQAAGARRGLVMA